MDNIGRVYTPSVVEDTPFPQGDSASFDSSQPVSGAGTKVYSAEKSDEQAFPSKKIATELLSSVLNTKSKKIIAEVQFTPSGALQIGNYLENARGDIRISETGIVARNKQGDITVAINGDTGDATFAGNIQTGALIAGMLLLGDGSIQIDGENRRMVFFADDGKAAIVIGNA